MPRLTEAQKDTLLALAGGDLPDPQVAWAVGTSAATVARWRARLLPAPAQGHPRRIGSARVARARGWPEGLTPRAVEVLEALCDGGPQTKAQLGVGRRGRPLALLIRAGLAHYVHAVAPGRGPTGRAGLYFPSSEAVALRREFLRRCADGY